jgi:hypothetical protein
MAAMQSRAWSVGLTLALAVGAALVASVAQADGSGASRWHGSRPRVGLQFGAPSGFSDPWAVHPLDPWYGSDGLYLRVDRSPAPRAECRVAYERGRSDALGGRPQACAGGPGPSCALNCRPAYDVAYARGLAEQARVRVLDQ